MDLIEGVGESSSPPRSFGSFSGNEIVNDVYNRLVEIGIEDAVNVPEFRDQLEAHFTRFPASYAFDVNMDRVEDVLLHQKLLLLARDPENRLIFHVRLLENFGTRTDVDDGDPQELTEVGFEPFFKLEDLNLEVRKSGVDKDRENIEGESSRRVDIPDVPVHEVIFSAIDKPKLLSQLSALLSDIDLNIREAHVFSTTDGYSLDVFVVDGWPFKETEALHEAMEKAIARSEGSWSGSSHAKSVVEKEADFVDAEIDRRSLQIGERIASGSCGDLFRGEYLGQDVAVKILRSEHLNQTLEDEFSHEVAILREVKHNNIVRFIGACTKQPPLCIITEYMTGGSLYDYLHKNHNTLMLPQLVKFAIDVCKGMDYLHKSNIIHRDLKTANLLMDSQNVVKVADFGVARFLTQGGAMTAETGTYRWMAPELMTAKVPYENMTPLQAALGVRQGLRPDVPTNTHPKLVELMERGWDSDPDNRPSFSKFKIELEGLLQEIQDSGETPNGN